MASGVLGLWKRIFNFAFFGITTTSPLFYQLFFLAYEWRLKNSPYPYNFLAEPSNRLNRQGKILVMIINTLHSSRHWRFMRIGGFKVYSSKLQSAFLFMYKYLCVFPRCIGSFLDRWRFPPCSIISNTCCFSNAPISSSSLIISLPS